MRVCQGCGGVLGRDCFNEMDCISISNSIEEQRHHEHERAANDMEERFWKLVEIVERHGIDVSELKPKPSEPTAQQRYDFGNMDNLPF